MKNRAKCKLCESIIESFHRYDYVTCKCGEISVSGGLDVFECGARDFSNFIRVDELGNEIIVKVVDSGEKAKEAIKEIDEPKKMDKKELVEMFETMLKNIEALPEHVMSLPINHYDFYSFHAVILSILKEIIKE